MRPLPLPDTPKLLLSFDFDGTFFSPLHTPPVVTELFTVLRRLREERDAIWVINTGRSLAHTLEGFLEGEFPFLPDFCISREQEIFHPNPLGRYVAFGDWNKRGLKVHDSLFKKAGGLLKRIEKYVTEQTQARYITDEGDPAGLIATSEEEMEGICEIIDPWLSEVPELSYERNTIYLRFAHRDYNKGTSLREVAESFNLGVDACFAIGDGANDLSMLDRKVASHLACPVNAAAMVKDRIREMEGYASAEEASYGVLQALEHFFPLANEEGGEEVIRLQV